MEFYLAVDVAVCTIELVGLLLIFFCLYTVFRCVGVRRQRQIGNKDHQSVTSFSSGKMALH